MHEERRSPGEIEHDIEETRARIERRARLLEERLRPGEILDQAIDRLRTSGARDFFSNLSRTVRDHPLPLLVTGAGLAWLMTLDRNGNGGHHLESDEGHDENGSHGIGSRVSDAADRVSGAAHAGSARVREAGRRAAHRAQEGTRRVQDGWDRLVDEQPLLLGVFGVAAGAALAAALPPSRTEDELIGAKSDELKARAARSLREQAEDTRERAERALREGREGQDRPADERTDQPRVVPPQGRP